MLVNIILGINTKKGIVVLKKYLCNCTKKIAGEAFLFLSRMVQSHSREYEVWGLCEIKGGGHRVPPAGLPIEQVLGEYSLSFLRRDIA